MAYARCLWLFSLLLLLCISYHGRTDAICRSIPLADVKVAVEASKFAYNDKVSVGQYVPGTRFKVKRVLNPSLHGKTLRAIVATYGSTTLIIFRGTNNFEQLIHQFRSALGSRSALYANGNPMHVLKYNWDALQTFSPDTLVPGGIKSGQKYIITGHSLGGALASLFAMYQKIKHTGLFTNPSSSLITFGQPRVGDRLYARMHDKLISPDRKLRFVYRQDVVPYIPPRPLYEHHSTKVWISKWWRIYRWDTYVQVCKRGDNPSGCRSKFTPQFNALQHGIDLYRKAIFSGPDRYYDRNGKQQKSFEASQCQ